MLKRKKTFFILLGFILCPLFSVFAAESENIHDMSKISFFVQPGISFLSFDEREYFQNAVDTIYHEFLTQALDRRDTLNVAKQDFQKVNFCFPLYAGIQFQPREDHFISAGLGFIYDNESVVMTDQNSRSHSYSYTIQGIPFFLEYRFAIPVNLMSLTGESLFSISVRWYWALPHTEIYTSWGKLAAETPYYGSGFGISVGYLLFNWRNLYVFGDLGYSSISVKSKKQYADIVPDGPEEKAEWNVGGIQVQIRVSLGVWNKPKVVLDSLENNKQDTSTENPLNGALDSSVVIEKVLPEKVTNSAISDLNESDKSISSKENAENNNASGGSESNLQTKKSENLKIENTPQNSTE